MRMLLVFGRFVHRLLRLLGLGMLRCAVLPAAGRVVIRDRAPGLGRLRRRGGVLHGLRMSRFWMRGCLMHWLLGLGGFCVGLSTTVVSAVSMARRVFARRAVRLVAITVQVVDAAAARRPCVARLSCSSVRACSIDLQALVAMPILARFVT